MAEIDWGGFARHVEIALGVSGLSYDAAVAKWPTLNKGLLSRACNGKPLSAGNFQHLCDVLALNPMNYLIVEKRKRVTMKTIVKQSVTVGVPRETSDRDQ